MMVLKSLLQQLAGAPAKFEFPAPYRAQSARSSPLGLYFAAVARSSWKV
jgi:hypothetical protein